MAGVETFGEVKDTGTEAEALKQRIVAQEQKISAHISEFSQKIKNSIDWRQYVEAYPYASLAVAAGAGWLLSKMVVPEAPSTMEKVSDIIQEAAGSRVSEFLRSKKQTTIVSALSGLALTAVAALARKAVSEGVRGLAEGAATGQPARAKSAGPAAESALWEATTPSSRKTETARWQTINEE